MTLKHRLAAAWCALNGDHVPWVSRSLHPDLQREQIIGASLFLDKLVGRYGRALWKKRIAAGLDPVTGKRSKTFLCGHNKTADNIRKSVARGRAYNKCRVCTNEYSKKVMKSPGSLKRWCLQLNRGCSWNQQLPTQNFSGHV